jgi:hypothetical protein
MKIREFQQKNKKDRKKSLMEIIELKKYNNRGEKRKKQTHCWAQ